jgi:hypothetical protein
MASLKLQVELSEFVRRIENRKSEIISYGKELKKAGGYKKFEIRFMFDVFRALYGSHAICEMYDKYNCNDTHQESLIREAFKQCKISINESDY